MLSHVYRSGINLYFTFAVLREDAAELEPAYFECWKRVIEATSKAGGGIAHHHGIGRDHAPWLEEEIGLLGMRVLRSLKQTFDPTDTLNPGILLPS